MSRRLMERGWERLSKRTNLNLEKNLHRGLTEHSKLIGGEVFWLKKKKDWLPRHLLEHVWEDSKEERRNSRLLT